MKLLSILLLLFLAASAQAQSLDKQNVILSFSNKTSTQTGSWVRVPTTGPYKLRQDCNEDSGTATVDTVVYDSPDCTDAKQSVTDTFAQRSTTGGGNIHIDWGTQHPYGCFKAVSTITGTGQWDCTVSVYTVR